MRLRPALRDDAPALARILGDWVCETGWMPVLHTREADAEFLCSLIGEAEVTLVEEDGPVGFLALAGEEVLALYLAPGARGRGLGRALISSAKAGRGRLSLRVFQANPRAVAFYLREGFVEEQRTDGRGNEEGLPDLLLAWSSAR